MEMRKFIIEISPDGQLTCCEYVPPEDRTLVNYQSGCKDTRARIENMLRKEITRAKHNASLHEYGPLWVDKWLTKASAYEFVLEKIRQTILK